MAEFHDNSVRTLALSLASSADAEQQTELESMLEEEDAREGLSGDAGIEVVNACTTDESYSAILTTLMRAFLLQVEKGPVKEGLAQAVCHLLVRRASTPISTEDDEFCLQKARDLLNTAKTMLDNALNGPEMDRDSLMECFLRVARDPVNDENHGRYIPALILAHHLRDGGDYAEEDQQQEQQEEEGYDDVPSWRKEFVDLLGRRIFALGGRAKPATRAEVILGASLIETLTKLEFDGPMVRPMKFKLMQDPDATLVTLCAFVSVLRGGSKGHFIDPHLKSGTNLVGTGLRQLQTMNASKQILVTDLFVELIKASPSKSTEMIIDALTNELKTGQSPNRVGLYHTLEGIAKALVELPKTSQDQVTKKDQIVKNMIDILSSSLEREENAEGDDEDNEEGMLAAESALDSWMMVRGDNLPKPQHNVARAAAAAAGGGASRGFNDLESDALAKTKARNAVSSGVPARPGAMAVSPTDASAVNIDRKAGKTSAPPFTSSTPVSVAPASNAGTAGKTSAPPFTSSTPVSVAPASNAGTGLDYMQSDAFAKASARGSAAGPIPSNPGAAFDKYDGQLKNDETSPMLQKTVCASRSTETSYISGGGGGGVKSSDRYKNDQINKKRDDNRPYKSLTPGKGKKKDDDMPPIDDGLAVAVAVNEEEPFYDAVFAEEYEPPPPLYKNRRFMTYSIGCFLIIVIITVSVTVTSTKKAVEDFKETMVPTFAPTPAPTTERDASGIKEKILLISPGAAEEGSIRFRAMDWIINGDKRQLDPYDPLLLQRYVLALLYYSTNPDGWTLCKQNITSPNCTYEVEVPTINGLSTKELTEGAWLGERHECDWFGMVCTNQKIIREIFLYGNNLIGTIPHEISKLSHVRRLWLNANGISGTILTEFGDMIHLADLQLHANRMTGSIPEEIFNASSLQNLNLAMNRFTGTISTRIGELSNLKGIQLFENKLKGTIPEEIGNLKHLAFLIFLNNTLEGPIPQTIGELKYMNQLVLSYNKLTGMIPAEIGNMKNLAFLNIEENQLDGTLPEEFFNLEKLNYLNLKSNKFSGTLSSNIGNLEKLQVLIVRTNDFTGTIPSSAGNLTNLEQVMFHFNKFTGTMPDSVCNLVDEGQIITGANSILYADCGVQNGKAAVECECCTDCCISETNTCEKN